MRRKIIAGNWKMFKDINEAKSFAETFKSFEKNKNVDIVICSPFTNLAMLSKEFCGSDVKLGAQNVHFEDEGAFTGEISAKMLTAIGVKYCIIGHSERREYFCESDEIVNKKLKKLLEKGITPILCVGENLTQREENIQFDVVENQLKSSLADAGLKEASEIVIAYEPIWAIGTGKTASETQAEEMCAYIRKVLSQIFSDEVASRICIQYGGSVNDANASTLLNMPNIDGALVGGASLDPNKFIKIVNYDR